MILVTLAVAALLQVATTVAVPAPAPAAAAAAAAAPAPATATELAVAPTTPPTRPSAQGRPEVVCEVRPRTGSRFTRHRCQSREAMEAHAQESRRLAAEMTRGTAAELPDGPR